MSMARSYEGDGAQARAPAEGELAEFRMLAARCSGGTSTSSIKDMVVRIIAEHRIKGRVLDFGAGTGELINRLARLDGLQMHGADILPRPVTIPDGVAWHQADLNDALELHEEPFDAVICSEVIEHLENPRSVFRNLGRLGRNRAASSCSPCPIRRRCDHI